MRIVKALDDLSYLIVSSQQVFIKTDFEVIECEFWNFSGSAGGQRLHFIWWPGVHSEFQPQPSVFT